MAEQFTILRDLSHPSTGEPYGAESWGPGPLASHAEPQLDVVGLEKSDLRDVARDPEVRAIAPVFPTTLVWPVSLDGDSEGDGDGAEAEAASVTWGVKAVGADVSARTGAGITVAVLDTGIDSAHPAFTGVTLTEKDFSGSGDGDKQGHGTHCAGTVFGRDVNGARIGVAPGVTSALIGKVLGDNGGGSSDWLFRGIQWAVQEGARVISMSLGFDFPGYVKQRVNAGWPVELATSAALEGYRANLRVFDALLQLSRSQAAFTPGTIIVAAAGNESRRQVDPKFEIGVSIPAAADGVVSVGALGESPTGLRVAPFSNTFPQIAAPGVAVLSAKSGGGLVSFNGTSMATPHVAGVAALWWEDVASSNLPVDATTVTARLLSRATLSSLDPSVDIADRGVGLVTAP